MNFLQGFMVFYDILTIFQELIKLQESFERLNSASTLVTSARMNIPSMVTGLHVNFWEFCLMHFVWWWKRIILNKSCYLGLHSPSSNIFLNQSCLNISPDFGKVVGYNIFSPYWAQYSVFSMWSLSVYTKHWLWMFD